MECFILAQRTQTTGHGGHAEKEQAKAEDSLTEIAVSAAAPKKVKERTDADGRKSDYPNLKGDNLSCNRCPDIGADDHTDRLRQVHHPGIGKTDNHNGRGAAALDKNCYHNPGENSHHRVIG